MTKRIVRWRGGEQVDAYYEAARYDPQRKQRKEYGSGTRAVLEAGDSLRQQCRHLDQNYDIATGAYNTLVQNVVGPSGVGIEPQPRTTSGSIHDDLAWSIQQAFSDWSMFPEVTGGHDWPSAQRLMARTWVRDGEGLSQRISGNVPGLDHGTRVPFSIELIEPDFLPFDYSFSGTPRIVAGVEQNGWGRPIAYHMYKQHPGDFITYQAGMDLKRVLADRMLHLKFVKRIGQVRGEPLLASTILRFDDVKDYDESERVAAKVAANMAAAITKGSPDLYQTTTDADGNLVAPRNMKFRAGMIFDDLRPGEEIKPIDTGRPNSQLEAYRSGQLRAAASGAYLTYSSLSKDYSGTYSAQRQELVEGYGAYGVLASEFIGGFVRPTYHGFLQMAITSGEIVIPTDIDIRTIGDAFYMPPQMPWIDPVKESVAFGTLEANGHASGIEIIRRRGQNPRDVADQQKRWLKMRPQAPAEDGSMSGRAFEIINSENI